MPEPQPDLSIPPEPRHIAVTRSARYYVLGDQSPGPRRELWIVVHGYGQLAARFLRHFAPFDDGTRLIAAPEALSRFYLEHPGRAGVVQNRVGATWMTREDREAEIADHVAYLDALADRLQRDRPDDRPTLHLLGFSQGVATIARWMDRGRIRPDHVVFWAGRVPSDIMPLADDHPLRRAVIDVVSGDEDEFASAEVLAEQRALFEAAGLRPRRHGYAGGHRLHPATLRQIVERGVRA